MSNTLLSPLPSLRLPDDDIPPATATLCRWHPQPRPRPPKPRSFSTPARHGTHSNQNHRPRYSFKPAAPSESGQVAQNLALNPHRPTLPPAHTPPRFPPSRLFGRLPPCAPRAVTGKHPKTLNDSGRSRSGSGTGRFPIAAIRCRTYVTSAPLRQRAARNRQRDLLPVGKGNA